MSNERLKETSDASISGTIADAIDTVLHRVDGAPASETDRGAATGVGSDLRSEPGEFNSGGVVESTRSEQIPTIERDVDVSGRFNEWASRVGQPGHVDDPLDF